MQEVTTAYRYIACDPRIRSGKPHVDGTRIGVHDVVGMFLNGSDIDAIVRSFPDITRAQVYECLAYYEDHRDAIDLAVARQMADSE